MAERKEERKKTQKKLPSTKRHHDAFSSCNALFSQDHMSCSIFLSLPVIYNSMAAPSSNLQNSLELIPFRLLIVVIRFV